MSILTNAQKRKILQFGVKRGEILEIFPGDNFDSILFLSQLSKKPIYGFGDYPEDFYKSILDKINYINITTPPFPNYNFGFQMILICEIDWLVDTPRRNIFSYFLDFLVKHLENRGILIITKSSFLDIFMLGLFSAKRGLNLIIKQRDDKNSIFILERDDKFNAPYFYEELKKNLLSKNK